MATNVHLRVPLLRRRLPPGENTVRLISFHVLLSPWNPFHPRSAPRRPPIYGNSLRSHSREAAGPGLEPGHPAPAPTLVTTMPRRPRYNRRGLYRTPAGCQAPAGCCRDDTGVK